MMRAHLSLTIVSDHSFIQPMLDVSVKKGAFGSVITKMSWVFSDLWNFKASGFADPPIWHVSWGAINTDLNRVLCKETWWGGFSDITPWGAAGEHQPPTQPPPTTATPTPQFLTCSLPLVLFHSAALPLIISSPSHPPTFILLFLLPVFYLPSTFGASFLSAGSPN